MFLGSLRIVATPHHSAPLPLRNAATLSPGMLQHNYSHSGTLQHDTLWNTATLSLCTTTTSECCNIITPPHTSDYFNTINTAITHTPERCNDTHFGILHDHPAATLWLGVLRHKHAHIATICTLEYCNTITPQHHCSEYCDTIAHT